MTEVPADELRLLLAEPLDRFVAVRNARVKALRAEGRREEAALLATVRKPNQLAARVAQLARADPDAAVGAVQAAEDLEAAQEGDGDLREAMAALRPAIGAVLASATARDRVDLGVPLRTVLADAEARQTWLEGLLTELPGAGNPPTAAAGGRHLTLVPTGEDATPRTGRRATSKRATSSADQQAETDATRQAAAEAERRAAEARAAARRELQATVAEAEATVATAAGDLAHAVEARRRASELAVSLRRDLAEAETEEVAAAADVTAVERRHAAVVEALDQARTALDRT